jgi:hypothetical protein
MSAEIGQHKTSARPILKARYRLAAPHEIPPQLNRNRVRRPMSAMKSMLG